ncbi:hypothetical protein B0O80DRAFT_499646 [Mortierella sp. GBAus27b]|nr:hypothetical protein BGX31_005095 [Mortierella sp. GBA43]KAI8352349.1 hypothetical protein B0O80DRAFT_499646 [Mortierella sp. GBAus27b]
MSQRKPFTLDARYLRAAVWILLFVWNLHAVLAAPIPQSSGGSSTDGAQTDYPANDTTLVDPFSTPDYLAPTKFTWTNCIYGLLFLFFGAIEVLHGYKYIRFTMLVTGFFTWASVAVMIMLIADINSGNYQASGAYFAVWFIVGLVGAMVSFYFWHIGIILTGAWGMFVVVAVVLTSVGLKSFVIRFAILAVCLVLGGYLTYRFERISVILATSLGGAYSFMFGLDMFIQAGFRATFHVILSQSTARFHPNVGTKVMIGFVPVIALLGIIWELKHHEEPVAGWWFGHGARPDDESVPSPDGKVENKRRCCGLVLSKPAPKKDPEAKPLPKIVVLPSKKEKRRCCLGGSSSSSNGNDKTKSRGCCIPLCCGRRTEKTTTPNPTSPPPPAATAAGNTIARPPPASARTGTMRHQETIGHTEHHKVVIQKEVRDYYAEIDEKW